MRFEHIIQINDGELPPLSRAMVWRGLAVRAYDPSDIVMGMEGCSIRHHERLADGAERLRRTLYFGAFEVEDEVLLTPEVEVAVHVPATERWASSVALARIEEPEPGALFVRFAYEWDDTHAVEQGLDEQARRLREQALMALDLDTVVRMRELAAGGDLH